MIVRTSAKSTLIYPGTVMTSEIPRVALYSTWFAISNASIIGVRRSMRSRSFWFVMTMSVSTFFFSSSIPSVACSFLFFPSLLNGFVTIPTTSAPILFAMFATNGAPPVPVPPPIPAVMKTISQPLSDCAISSLSSSTARKPTLGSEPAPRPRVRFLPIWILCSALLRSKAWRSVLMVTKSTPVSPLSIMLLTALPPPPPTPMTRIFAPRPDGMSSSIGTVNSPCIICGFVIK